MLESDWLMSVLKPNLYFCVGPMSDAVASTPQAVRQFLFIVGEDGNLHKDVYHGTSTLLVADNN